MQSHCDKNKMEVAHQCVGPSYGVETPWHITERKRTRLKLRAKSYFLWGGAEKNTFWGCWFRPMSPSLWFAIRNETFLSPRTQRKRGGKYWSYQHTGNWWLHRRTFRALGNSTNFSITAFITSPNAGYQGAIKYWSDENYGCIHTRVVSFPTRI